MESSGGMKEMYDITLRLNSPIEIGKKKYDINEAVLSFASAQIAQFQESKSSVQARGGYHNPALVNWEIDKEASFALTNGVLSPTSWALLSNSKLNEPNIKSVQFYETLHTIEDEKCCFVDLKYRPNNCNIELGAAPKIEGFKKGPHEEIKLKPLPPSKTKWVFCYDADTGQKIRDFEIYQNRIYFYEGYRNVMVDYTFTYEDKIKVIEVGNRLFNGFLRLNGKMSVKDENSGEVSTAILEMPKIRLSSNLSLRLGKSYDASTVSDFYFTGYVDESRRREEQSVAYITFLDKELTGDYI